MAIAQRLGPSALGSMLPRTSSWTSPKYQALADEIVTLLFDGRVAPNTALPSERELAEHLGVSRSTTTAAYRALSERGVLTSRRGSGSVLRLPPNAQVAGLGARVQRPDQDLIDLSVAAIPAESDVLDVAATVCGRLGDFMGSIGYHPYGLPELREVVARGYAERGVPTSADQILITNGAQHGLDLLLRSMLGPGERVLTELPCYPGALDAIANAGGRVVAVPCEPDGRWDTAALTATLRQSAPRFAFLIPDFNNPTGALIDAEQRETALAAARRAGTRVIVDESFINLDLREGEPSANVIHNAGHDPHSEGHSVHGNVPLMPPACAALDGSVISLGSVSKPIWGGIRVGWIRAESELISQLAVVRARSDMSGSVLDQLVVTEILNDPTAWFASRRVQLRQRRDTLLAALAEQLPRWQTNRPDGGLFLWIRLDEPASTALARRAEELGVLTAPGSRFASVGSLERYLRLPYTLAPELLTEAVQRLAVAWSTREVRPGRSSGLLPI